MLNPYLFVLSAGHLIVDLAQGVLPIIMPLLSEKLSLNYFQIGTVALAFTFSSAIIQPAFGVFSDRYSMPWLMPLGLFLSGVGMALTGMTNSYGLLLFVVLLSGIGLAGYHPEASKLAHYVSEEGKAGASMAVFSVGGNIGFGLGPVLAIFILGFSGLDSIYGVAVPGVLGALVFMFLLPRFKSILAKSSPAGKGKGPEPKPGLESESEPGLGPVVKSGSGPEPGQEPKLLRAKRSGPNRIGSLVLLILYVIVRSWMHFGIVYFIPFYFPDLGGLAKPEYLISIFLIAGAVGTVLGGPFADRFGGRNGLLVSMIVSLVAVYPFLHLGGFFVPLLAFVVGAALISTFSTTVVFGQRLLPQNIGLASGLMLGFSVGMGSVGVTLLGAVADRVGLPLVMNIICLLPIIGIVLAFTLPDIRTGQPGATGA